MKISYPDKIKGHHSYNNETCILYNICDNSTSVTIILELDETENRTLGESENRIIHVTIRTLTDLEKFTSVYHNTTIYNETCIHYRICDYSSNVTSTLELNETENRTLGEPENGITYVTNRTLADL